MQRIATNAAKTKITTERWQITKTFRFVAECKWNAVSAPPKL
jgi:hypothetical protein